MTDPLVLLLAGCLAALVTVTARLWLRLRLLEQTVAFLAPAHSVDVVTRQVVKLEGQVAVGLSGAAQALHNLQAQHTLVMAALKMHASEGQVTRVSEGEIN